MEFSKRELKKILKDKKGIKDLRIKNTLCLDIDKMGDSPYCEFVVANRNNCDFKTKVSFNLVIDFNNKEITIENVEQIGKRKLPKEYKYQKNWIKEFRNYNDLDILLSNNTEFIVLILENLDLNGNVLNELYEFSF